MDSHSKQYAAAAYLYVCQALTEQKRLAEDLSYVLETANAFICAACAPVFDGSLC